MDLFEDTKDSTDVVDPANLPLWTDHPELEEARQELGKIQAKRKDMEEQAERLERELAERKMQAEEKEPAKARARIERRNLEDDIRDARQRVDELILEEEKARDEFEDVLESVAEEYQQAADEVAPPILRKFAEAVREFQKAHKLLTRLNAYYERLNNRYRRFRDDQTRAPITKPYDLRSVPGLDASDWEQLADNLEASADSIE